MNDGINLLVSTKRPKTVEPANVRLLRLFGLGILFIIGVSAIVLFILISFSPLPRLQKEEQELVSELSQYRNRIATLTVASQRADDLSKFLTKRRDYPAIMALVSTILPTDAKVIAVKVVDYKVFNFSIESKSLATLDSVIKKLDTLNKPKSTFSKAKMLSLGFNDDLSAFILKIEFVLP